MKEVCWHERQTLPCRNVYEINITKTRESIYYSLSTQNNERKESLAYFNVTGVYCVHTLRAIN